MNASAEMIQDPDYQAALNLHRAGQFDAAQAAYVDLTLRYPDAPDLLAKLGSVQLQAGDLATGLETLDRSLALAPEQVDALLDRANGRVLLHRLDEALEDYDAALRLAPDQTAAWHNRGELLLSLGRAEPALACFEEVVRLAPDDGEGWLRHAECLRQLGRYQDAETSLQQAGMTTPNPPAPMLSVADALLANSQALAASVEAGTATLWNERGRLLALQDQAEEALACFVRAAELDPEDPEAWFNQGLLCVAQKQFEDALSHFDQVLTLQPEHETALINRGAALMNLERHEEALRHYERALEFEPESTAFQTQRGLALLALYRNDEALAAFASALDSEPERADLYGYRAQALKELRRIDEALLSTGRAIVLSPLAVSGYVQRAQVLLDLNRPPEALVCAERAVFLEPTNSDMHSLKGTVLQRLQRDADALACHDRALELNPQSPGAWVNRGLCLMTQGQAVQALAQFDEALALQPDAVDAHWNKALCHLTLGEYEEGWRQYEWRWRQRENDAYQARWPDKPVWLGDAALIGKTLLVLAEQGLGDNLQFCRYAPWLSDLGAKVILATPTPLVGLLSTLRGDVRVVDMQQPLAVEIDYVCPVMSLPLAFGTRLATVPARVPYVSAPPEVIEEWEQRLGDDPRPRIGLAWSGNSHHKGDHSRSMTLDILSPLLSLPADFHVLQKDIREADAALLAEYPNLITHGEAIHGFDRTAALMMNLDLVISVDTSMAHLAGALGVPVWLLLAQAPDYRWMLDRADSPWYPTMTIYRQTAAGEWSTMVSELTQRLTTLLQSTSSNPEEHHP